MFKSFFDSIQKYDLNDFDKELLSSNLVGAKNTDDLFKIERDITEMKQQLLRKTPVKGNFDYKHLKEIHKELLKDIYGWAGKDRYDISYRGAFRKGNSEFTHGSILPEVAEGLFNALEKENYFKDLDREASIKSLASFLNGLNILHPFREGNGRVQRLFIEELAKNAGYSLDLSNVSQYTMIQASIQGVKNKNIKGFEMILGEHLKKISIKIPHKIDSILEMDTKKTTSYSRYRRR